MAKQFGGNDLRKEYLTGCGRPGELVEESCLHNGRYVYLVKDPQFAVYSNPDGTVGYGTVDPAQEGSTLRMNMNSMEAECNIGEPGSGYGPKSDVFPHSEATVPAPRVQGCGSLRKKGSSTPSSKLGAVELPHAAKDGDDSHSAVVRADVNEAKVFRMDIWVVPRFVPGNPFTSEEMEAFPQFDWEYAVVCGDLMRPDGIQPIPFGCYTPDMEKRKVDATWRLVIVAVLGTGKKLIMSTKSNAFDSSRFVGERTWQSVSDPFATLHALRQSQKTGRLESESWPVDESKSYNALYRGTVINKAGTREPSGHWGFQDAVNFDMRTQDVTITKGGRYGGFDAAASRDYDIGDNARQATFPVVQLVAIQVPPKNYRMMEPGEKKWLENQFGEESAVVFDRDATVCYDSLNDDVSSLTLDPAVAGSRFSRFTQKCKWSSLDGYSNMLFWMAVLSNGHKVAGITKVGFKPQSEGKGSKARKDPSAKLFELTQRVTFSALDGKDVKVVQPDLSTTGLAFGDMSPDVFFHRSLLSGYCSPYRSFGREGRKSFKNWRERNDELCGHHNGWGVERFIGFFSKAPRAPPPPPWDSIPPPPPMTPAPPLPNRPMMDVDQWAACDLKADYDSEEALPSLRVSAINVKNIEAAASLGGKPQKGRRSLLGSGPPMLNMYVVCERRKCASPSRGMGRKRQLLGSGPPTFKECSQDEDCKLEDTERTERQGRPLTRLLLALLKA